jgi:hypothetical protein
MGTQKYIYVFQGFGGKNWLAPHFRKQYVVTGSYLKINFTGHSRRLDSISKQVIPTMLDLLESLDLLLSSSGGRPVLEGR